MKNIFYANRFNFGILAIIFLLSGCHHHAPNPTATELIIQQFQKTRAKGIIDDGVRTVTSGRQNLSTLDCMVFNETAKNAYPTSLGGWTARLDSMRLRIVAGCAPPMNALIDYETARRGVLAQWNIQLSALPTTSQILIQSTPMGELIKKEISNVMSEETVCLAKSGLNVRNQHIEQSLDENERACNLQSAVNTPQDECQNAWMNVSANDTAIGPRDDLSYLSELVSRYKMAYLVCSPNATREYLEFHQMVPKELYAKAAYRLAIAIDPITACTISEVSDLMSKNQPYDSQRQWIECAKKYKLSSLYSTDVIPHIITPKILSGSGNSWLFDPQQANLDPNLWTFGDCEKKVIAYMQYQHLNLTTPKSIKQYCRNHVTSSY